MIKMKKAFLSLLTAGLFSSCIVIKVYDSPKSEAQEPKVIAKKRMMLPSDRTIPLPTGDKEILFFGEDIPPTPEVFHFKLDDSLMGQFSGDSLNHKGVFIIKLDNMDSLSKGGDFQWKSNDGAMLQVMPLMKDCLMMSSKECPAMDSLASSAMAKIHADKSIRVITIDKTAKEDESKVVIRTKGGENSKAPLIIIDGEEKVPGYDLKNISPDQIERIDVLKDEAAIKKVGEKGANGVIMIKMKKQ